MSRLAIVAPHFPEYALRYASGMAAYGEVLLCVDSGQFADEYANRSVTLPKTLELRGLRFKTIPDFVRLYRMLRTFKPTILHFQEACGPRRALFNVAIARLFRNSAAIVVTVHDPMAHAGRDEVAARRSARIAAHLRHMADRIIVHGAFCAGQVTAVCPSLACRLIVSEHGLILEPQDVRAPLEPPPLRLYFFGRMEKYKGLEVLLTAAEELHDTRVDFVLTVAGSGPELDRLETRFAALPELRVCNEFVAATQIMDDIQAAECVVLPYLDATQSGVLAAAYAGRRYVVASAVGGLPDVVEHGENGLLVPPGNPAALADAVRLLAKDGRLRARLGQGACATANGRLSWTQIASSLNESFELLTNCLNRGQATGGLQSTRDDINPGPTGRSAHRPPTFINVKDKNNTKG